MKKKSNEIIELKKKNPINENKDSMNTLKSKMIPAKKRINRLGKSEENIQLKKTERKI